MKLLFLLTTTTTTNWMIYTGRHTWRKPSQTSQTVVVRPSLLILIVVYLKCRIFLLQLEGIKCSSHHQSSAPAWLRFLRQVPVLVGVILGSIKPICCSFCVGETGKYSDSDPCGRSWDFFSSDLLKSILKDSSFTQSLTSILLPLVDWCLFWVSSRRKQLSPVFEGWSLRWWWCDDGSSDVAHTGAWYSCLIIGRLLVYFSLDSQATGSVWENSELTKGVNVSGFNWTTTAGIGSSSTFHYSIIFNFIFFQTLHD